jgi:protein-S-isoprenylcysteine O-methyltransferase Ste14
MLGYPRVSVELPLGVRRLVRWVCRRFATGAYRKRMVEWSQIARRIRVPLGFLFALFYFWLARPSWRSLVLGAIGVVPGLVIRALASGHVRKNEALATSGPYAYTRNPLYLGSLVMGLGFCVAARSWWVGVALIVMFVAIYVPVIRDEEAFLGQRFPEFDEYARRVPRMLPRLTLHSSDEGEASAGFSWELYWKHREYNALLGALGMMVALIVKMELFRP